MTTATRWLLAAAITTTLGCEALNDVRGDVEDVLNDPIVTQAMGLTVAGVTPAHDFRQTGNIDFDLLPEDDRGELVSFANLQQSGMAVQVKNHDGTYSDCEYVDSETVEPLPHHTLTLLLDGSGSMELAYPPQIHGDVCVTCPHDPERERIHAAHDLIRTIHDASPMSPMAVAEFGPDPSEGFGVTRMHSDFINAPEPLIESLDYVQGYEPVGTPLYDSLAEMVDETRAAARALEATLRHERGEDVPWEEDTTYDIPETDKEVARHIVVLSDGIDNESTQYDVDAVIDFALEAGVKIYAVGLGPASASSADPDNLDPEQTQAVRNLHRLARETGGFYAAAKNPSQLRELYATLGQALTEGYQVETYECIPKPTHDTPQDECDVPPVGSRIDGRLRMSDVDIPWVTIAN